MSVEFLMATIFTIVLILELLSVGPHIFFSETAVLAMFIYARHMKASPRTTETTDTLVFPSR